MHQGNHEIQHEGSLGPAEALSRWAWALLEFSTAPFSLVLGLFWHKNPGRRSFSLPGVIVTYFLILAIFFAGGFVGAITSKPGGWKPQIVIDPFQRQTPQRGPTLRSPDASTEKFYWSLRLFLAMAVAHKVMMQVRRLRRTEPELTVYSGDSRIQFLLAYVPWLKALSVNDEDACKRFLEPVVSWLLAKLVITAYMDPIVGNFYCWCSLAMAVKAHCVRTRHLYEKDDLQDVRVRWQQRFKYLEMSQRHASDEAVRVRSG